VTPVAVECEVCVVGGGPAGVMAGLLLARAGVSVVVLEKHADFLRDFRGDTVHPSTLDVLGRLGLGAAVERLPHRKVREASMTFADGTYRIGDLTRLRSAHRYLALVPQWDLLEMLASHAASFPTFTLLRSHEVVDLVREGGRVVGAVASGPAGDRITVRAGLTIGADGRHSVIRQRLGLAVTEFGAPMDVLWFRVERRRDDDAGLRAFVGAGRMFICIDRGEYWQVAGVIPRGGYRQVVAAGLDAFRSSFATIVDDLADRAAEIVDWDQIKVLTVQVNRARRWHTPGALLIGDAAHAMSPIGGVGINLAVQDAVAAVRLLAAPLLAGSLGEADLEQVRRRRWLPTVGTQLGQRLIQRAVIGRVLGAPQRLDAPLPVRVIGRSPMLQGLMGRLIGVGIRPEQVGPGPRVDVQRAEDPQADGPQAEDLRE